MWHVRNLPNDTVGNTTVWRDDKAVIFNIDWDTAERVAHYLNIYLED